MAKWVKLVLVILLQLALPMSGWFTGVRAAPVTTINFDDLVPDTLVSDQYLIRGVRFTGGAVAASFASSPFGPEFAHSDDIAITQSCPTGFPPTPETPCANLPINMIFALPQSRVEIWVGYTYGIPHGQNEVIVLTAFDAHGISVGSDSVTFYGPSIAPTPINHPLEVRSSLVNISWAQISSSRPGLDVDDVAFEAATVITVHATRVEVNQGVQWQLFPVPLNKLQVMLVDRMTGGPFYVPLVPGKDTAVRYYLHGNVGAVPFTGELKVSIVNKDGTSMTQVFSPNTNLGIFANVPAEPNPGPSYGADLANLLDRMHADGTMTLNFVVPGSWLENAKTLGLSLEVVTGETQITLQDQVHLLLDVIHVHGGGTDGPLPDSDWMSSHSTTVRNVTEYLKAVYPAEILIIKNRDFNATTSDCHTLLNNIRTTFDGDGVSLTAAYFSGPPPDHSTLVHLAFAQTIIGCGGLGDYRDLSDASTRLDGFAEVHIFIGLAHGHNGVIAAGDTAAQEIDHTFYLIHASAAHGATSGGQTAEDGWPYPSGRIGTDSPNLDSRFPPGNNTGVIMSSQRIASEGDAGQWTLTLVDHCLREAATGLCRAWDPVLDNNNVAYDFMSYGSGNEDLGDLNWSTENGRWVSDITYRRVYDSIFYLQRQHNYHCVNWPPDAIREWCNLPLTTGLSFDPDEGRIEALIVSGSILSNGTIQIDPLIRKPLPRLMVDQQHKGPYDLKLLDTTGSVLLDRSFDIDQLPHGEIQTGIFLIIPFIENAKRLVIEKDGRTLLAKSASPNDPQVHVISPNGGELWSTGVHVIKWTANDPDGDPLTFLVQYSPDGGNSWQGIALVKPGQAFEAQYNVTELISGRSGVIRVTASDGFNTAYDVSDSFFSVGTVEQPTQGGLTTRTMSTQTGSVSSLVVLQNYGPYVAVAVMVLLIAVLALMRRKRTRFHS